jgi:hypothetical protein
MWGFRDLSAADVAAVAAAIRGSISPLVLDKALSRCGVVEEECRYDVRT